MCSYFAMGAISGIFLIGVILGGCVDGGGGAAGIFRIAGGDWGQGCKD